jgi:hypothetical protein
LHREKKLNIGILYRWFFQKNRSEFLESTNSFAATIRLIFKNYVYGHYQDPTLYQYVILTVSLFALVVVILNRSWKQEKLFIGLHLANFLLSVWYAFWWYKGWIPLKQ